MRNEIRLDESGTFLFLPDIIKKGVKYIHLMTLSTTLHH